MKTKACKHRQPFIKIINKTHEMGGDTYDILMWCRSCGAFKISDPYKDDRSRWTKPNERKTK